MNANDITRADAATPTIQSPAGGTAATAGTLALPGQAAASGVSLAHSGPVAATDIPWGQLPGPLKHVAQYLPLRDRLALAQASRFMRDALGQRSDTTLEWARQVSTLSGMAEILRRLETLSDVNDRVAVLTALAARTDCFARAHRQKAWRQLLQQCDRLPPAVQGRALAELARIPTVARISDALRGQSLQIGVDDCLSMLDRRLAGLPPGGRAALTFALLSAREPVRPGKMYFKPPPRMPFDLPAHLALVPLLPADQHRPATQLAVSFHLLSPGTPAELWGSGFAAACAQGCAPAGAWTLVALMESRTIEGQRLLSAQQAPQQAWRLILAQAGRLNAGDAVNVAIALSRCLKAGWARGPFRSDGIEALWDFSHHQRFDVDQRGEMLAALAWGLSPQQWHQGWGELVERCTVDGVTPSRRARFRALLDATPRPPGSTPFSDLQWQSGMALIDAIAISSPATAAALYCMMAGRIAQLPTETRATAFHRLLDSIDSLPPAWRGQPLSDLLAEFDTGTRAGTALPRLSAVAPLARARWLGPLLAAPPQMRPAALMQTLMDALNDAPSITDEAAAVLADVLRQARRGAMGRPSDVARLAAGLPALLVRIDLVAQPALALELAKLAIVAHECSMHSRDGIGSDDMRTYRDLTDFLTGVVKRLPIESRQALLLQLKQGPSTREEGVADGQSSTAWILDVAASLPPLYRAEVLRRWAEADNMHHAARGIVPMMILEEPTDDLDWSRRREVWQAIRTLPAEYLAPLLDETTDWFQASVYDRARSGSERAEGFASAKAQWSEALQRLPVADQLEIPSLVHPELAAAWDTMLGAGKERFLSAIWRSIR